MYNFTSINIYGTLALCSVPCLAVLCDSDEQDSVLTHKSEEGDTKRHRVKSRGCLRNRRRSPLTQTCGSEELPEEGTSSQKEPEAGPASEGRRKKGLWQGNGLCSHWAGVGAGYI